MSAEETVTAELLATVRDELLSRLDGVSVDPGVIVDLGAGKGQATVALKRRYRKALVVALDNTPSRLRETRRRSRFWRPLRCVAGDATRLPLREGSFDLVFSSLMLRGSEDLDTTLGEIAGVLKPGGLLLFASLGPETLRELRTAWASVDDAVHVNAFIDMHDLGSALQRAGFAEPVLDVDRHVLRHADAMSLMRELKAIGIPNRDAGRRRTLMTPARLARVVEAYERYRGEGGLPATYEVVYGVAWAPTSRRMPLTVAAETRLSFDRLRDALRSRRP